MIAGAVQFTAWKARRLACCREAPGRGRAARAGAGAAWRYGWLRQGRCILCCANLTAIVLVVGVMDLGGDDPGDGGDHSRTSGAGRRARRASPRRSGRRRRRVVADRASSQNGMRLPVFTGRILRVRKSIEAAYRAALSPMEVSDG